MADLMQLIGSATTYLLRSIHMVYTLMSVVAFVYIGNVLMEAIDSVRLWSYESSGGRVISGLRLAIGIIGAVLLLLAWF